MPDWKFQAVIQAQVPARKRSLNNADDSVKTRDRKAPIKLKINPVAAAAARTLSLDAPRYKVEVEKVGDCKPMLTCTQGTKNAKAARAALVTHRNMVGSDVHGRHAVHRIFDSACQLRNASRRLTFSREVDVRRETAEDGRLRKRVAHSASLARPPTCKSNELVRERARAAARR